MILLDKYIGEVDQPQSQHLKIQRHLNVCHNDIAGFLIPEVLMLNIKSCALNIHNCKIIAIQLLKLDIK